MKVRTLKRTTLAAGVLFANAIIMQVAGVAYQPFNWMALAATYSTFNFEKLQMKQAKDAANPSGQAKVKGNGLNSAVCASYAADLTANAVTASFVDLDGSFDATVTLTGCTVASGKPTKCKSVDKAVKAKFKDDKMTPALKKFQVKAKGLTSAQTGLTGISTSNPYTELHFPTCDVIYNDVGTGCSANSDSSKVKCKA